MRKFDSGATRDTDIDKPNYVKALSPIVIDCYVEYIGKHRKQADGSLRNWDNWKQGMPIDVYVEGEDRHHRAVWKLHQGFPAYDNHGPVTMKDSLCGVIFNAMGHLHELLKAEEQKQPEIKGFCPKCREKIAAAKPGSCVALCEKCKGRE